MIMLMRSPASSEVNRSLRITLSRGGNCSRRPNSPVRMDSGTVSSRIRVILLAQYRHDDIDTMIGPESCHIQLFNKRTRSYNELPLRYSEFGSCHRDEPSGSLQGLMRTRAFVQDDAHVFCAEDHLETEIGRFCHLLRAVYEDFGFSEFKVAFSTRPDLRTGSDETWNRAEAALANAASAPCLSFEMQAGEGAFYGPKLEFHLTDSRGRNWQCGTVQLDFFRPQRLDASFVNDQGHQETPVMIHHAILGNMERFIGIILEHYEGWLPVWLAPEQVVVSTVTSSDLAYALEVAAAFKGTGIRAVLDGRTERLGKKIVDARDKCIPLMAVVGARDALNRTISLRRRNDMQETRTLDDTVASLRNECATPGERRSQNDLLEAGN